MSLVSTPIAFDSVLFESEKKETKAYLSQAGKFCKYDGGQYEKGDKITLSDGTQMVCSDPPKWDIL